MITLAAAAVHAMLADRAHIKKVLLRQHVKATL